MISVSLQGGLGNYMFQIATSYSLALDNDDTFILDPKRNYTTHRYVSDYRNNILRNLRFGDFNVTSHYQETNFTYTPITYESNMLLSGYFQSEKYFTHNRDKVLNLFSIDGESKKYINDKYGDLFNSDTCSLHVRRGDYLNLPNHHPICEMSYYEEALKNFPNSRIVVFSNDIDWCKSNFSSLPYEFVYIEGNEDYIDMWLMSLCDNNIIANSSFSWWGAWLNDNPNKRVIVPKKWFGPAIGHNINDLIPGTWEMI